MHKQHAMCKVQRASWKLQGGKKQDARRKEGGASWEGKVHRVACKQQCAKRKLQGAKCEEQGVRCEVQCARCKVHGLFINSSFMQLMT